MLLENSNMEYREIANFPPELRIEIIDNLSMDGLREAFFLEKNQGIRDHISQRAKKYVYWSDTDPEDLAEEGDLEGLQWLAARGVDVLNEYIIGMAAWSGNLELIQWLFDQGANISQFGVMKAVKSGNLDLVKWLFENGADKSYFLHEMVIRSAVEDGDIEMVKWLADQGADMSQSKYDFLHYAIKSGNLELVQWLVDQGAIIRGYHGVGEGTPEIQEWLREQQR